MMLKTSLNLEELLEDIPEQLPAKALVEPFVATQLSANYQKTNSDRAAAWCFEQHTQKHGPPPAVGDGHNNWVAAFAKFGNEKGAPEADILALALSTAPAGHDTKRITDTVTGIYKRDAADFGSNPYTAPVTRRVPPPPGPPSDVYDQLPDFLRRCTAPFEGHEKAVMLLSTLSVLSGCFHGVGGTYAQREYGLNLYVFILAAAASGKGSAAWAQRLGRNWHKRLLAESAAILAEHEAEQAARSAAEKGKPKSSAPPTPPPPRRMLYLPGNITAAGLVGALAENGERGIMFEAEADTLSTALGNDSGGFSDVLRKNFQHEPISLLRKTDRQYLDLERPSLSICLTGTPGQLPRLMRSPEDGLVSRFIFYWFEQPPVWRDVSPRAGKPLDGYFKELSEELSQMIEAAPTPTEDEPYPAKITLSVADWARVNEAGAIGLAEAVEDAGTAGGSTAYRLGLIAWRIVGILTVLRGYENGEAPIGEMVADERDVTTALRLMDSARAHALHVLDVLPATPTPRTNGKQQRAEQRTSKMASAQELHQQGISIRQIAETLNTPKSTIENWLK
jgi:hypothetical protein